MEKNVWKAAESGGKRQKYDRIWLGIVSESSAENEAFRW